MLARTRLVLHVSLELSAHGVGLRAWRSLCSLRVEFGQLSFSLLVLQCSVVVFVSF